MGDAKMGRFLFSLCKTVASRPLGRLFFFFVLKFEFKPSLKPFHFLGTNKTLKEHNKPKAQARWVTLCPS